MICLVFLPKRSSNSGVAMTTVASASSPSAAVRSLTGAITMLFATLVLATLIAAPTTSSAEGRSLVDYLVNEKRDCDIYQNEALHAVLDKLCGDCNELFRHEVSDLHSKCRRNCFENRVFQMCWQAISPSGGGRRRK